MQINPEAVANLIKDLQNLPSLSGGFLPPPPPPPLNPPNNGGNPSDMEARVRALEVQTEGLRRDIAKLENVPTALATLTANVSHLPSKGYIATWVSSAIGLLLVAVTFSEKLQTLVN